MAHPCSPSHPAHERCVAIGAAPCVLDGPPPRNEPRTTGGQMAATVVCISRTDGASGGAVGTAVASELGYRYVDQEVVVRAAEKAKVDRATVEDAERRKSFVRRLLESLSNPIAAEPLAGLHSHAFSLHLTEATAEPS